jgi:hypothetical protein
MTRRNAFLRRQQERVETSSPTTSGDRVGTESVREKADWLSFVEKLSQIVLVVVAVFGYFYTVKPIYQKGSAGRAGC